MVRTLGIDESYTGSCSKIPVRQNRTCYSISFSTWYIRYST